MDVLHHAAWQCAALWRRRRERARPEPPAPSPTASGFGRLLAAALVIASVVFMLERAADRALSIAAATPSSHAGEIE
ncbi:hypothetical protein [Mesorhizobium marinum]|uniref:Uncharacterized protein n=1 Tax=Mesorhizobium marinum TaxID=3228790 RepID=A0ABV3QXM3_9HYPH